MITIKDLKIFALKAYSSIIRLLFLVSKKLFQFGNYLILGLLMVFLCDTMMYGSEYPVKVGVLLSLLYILVYWRAQGIHPVSLSCILIFFKSVKILCNAQKNFQKY